MHGAVVNNYDKYGYAALHSAVSGKKSMAVMVELLFTAWEDPNSLDSRGLSPLYQLAHWQKKDPFQALKLMQQYGADINLRNKEGGSKQNGSGETPLDIALKRKNSEAVQELRAADALGSAR